MMSLVASTVKRIAVTGTPSNRTLLMRAERKGREGRWEGGREGGREGRSKSGVQGLGHPIWTTVVQYTEVV